MHTSSRLETTELSQHAAPPRKERDVATSTAYSTSIARIYVTTWMRTCGWQAAPVAADGTPMTREWADPQAISVTCTRRVPCNVERAQYQSKSSSKARTYQHGLQRPHALESSVVQASSQSQLPCMPSVWRTLREKRTRVNAIDSPRSL